MSKIYKLAKIFERKAAKTSMQPADIQDALEQAGLWGGKSGGFDPNSDVADKVFKIIDKYAPESGSFKISAKILVPKTLQVSINASAPKHAGEISRELTAVFSRSMSGVLKNLSKKMDPPPETIELKWLKNVGY